MVREREAHMLRGAYVRTSWHRRQVREIIAGPSFAPFVRARTDRRSTRVPEVRTTVYDLCAGAVRGLHSPETRYTV